MLVMPWMESAKEDGGGDNYIIMTRLSVCEYNRFVSYISSLSYLLFENLKLEKTVSCIHISVNF